MVSDSGQREREREEVNSQCGDNQRDQGKNHQDTVETQSLYHTFEQTVEVVQET